MPPDKHFYYAKYREMLPEIKYYMRLKLTPLVYIHEHFVRQQLCRALARWSCHAQLECMAAHQRELSTRLEKIGVWLIQSRMSTQFALACRHLCRIHRFRALATGFLRWKQQVTQYGLIVAQAPVYMDWILTSRSQGRVAAAIDLLQFKGRGLLQVQRKRLVRHQRARFRRWRQATLGHTWLRKRLVEWKERLRLHLWREWVQTNRLAKARGAQNALHLQSFRTRHCIHRWNQYRCHVQVERVLSRVSTLGCRRTMMLAVFIRLQNHILRQRKLRRAIRRFTVACTNYCSTQVRDAWTIWTDGLHAFKAKRDTISSVLRRMLVYSLRQGFLQWRLHCVGASHKADLARVEADAGRIYGAKATIRIWQLAMTRRLRRAFHHLRTVRLHTKQGDAHRNHMALWACWVQWRQYRHSSVLERRNSAHDLKWTNFQTLHRSFKEWTRMRVVTKAIQTQAWRQWRQHLHHHDVLAPHLRTRRACLHWFRQWTRWVHDRRRQRLTELGVPCGTNVDLTTRTVQWLVTRHCFAKWKSHRHGHVPEGLMQRVWGHQSHRYLRQSMFERWRHATVLARKQALVEDGASMEKLLRAVTNRVQRHSSRALCRQCFQVWRAAATQQRRKKAVLQRVVTTLRSGNLVRSFGHWKTWTDRYAISSRLFATAMQTSVSQFFRTWRHKIHVRKQLRRVGARWMHGATMSCLAMVWRAWAAIARVRQQLARHFKQLRNQCQQRMVHHRWQHWRQAFIATATTHEANRQILQATWSIWTRRLEDYTAQRRLLRRLTTRMYMARLRRGVQRWNQYLLFHVSVHKTQHLQARLAERDHQLRELLTDQATRCRQFEQLVSDRHKMMQLLEESRHKLQQFKRLQSENQELKRLAEHSDRHEKLVEQLRGQCRLSERLIGQVEAENERLRAERERQEVAAHVRLSELSMQLAEAREVCIRLKDLEQYNQQLEDRLQAQEEAQKRAFLEHAPAAKVPYEP